MSPTASDQALDAWFRVLSPSGIELLSQDRASDNMPETYDLLVEGGFTYFIQCRSADLWSSGAGNYKLSVELFVPPTILSAYWVTPNKTSTVFGGTPIQLKAKVAGFSVGEVVNLDISEYDFLSPNDFVIRLNGTVYSLGSDTYVSVDWTANWIDDAGDDPQFYFEVTGKGGSRTSNLPFLTVIPTDPDDRIGKSISLGSITASRETNGGVKIPDDVNVYSFQVSAGQTITFDIDRPSGSLVPLLRLFNSNGLELKQNAGGIAPLETPADEAFIQYTFANAGTYYIGVSGVGNAVYNVQTGGNDTNGSIGIYRLTVSPGLAGHVLKKGQTAEYLVDLIRMDKPGQPIDSLKTTWVVIHGWNSSPSKDSIKELVSALIQSRPMDQVLTLDWSSIANSGFGLTAPGEAASGIVSVGFWASETLKQAGFSGRQLNIIGHSFGSYVGDELAKFFPGKVNSIVALDPAANVVSQVFDPVSNDEVNFIRDSEWSWAFHSSSLGNEYTPARANEAFVFDSGLVAWEAHSAPIYLFAYMITHPYELVSKLFSLDSLLDMVYGPWALDQYVSYFGGVLPPFTSDDPVLGYEAVITGYYGGVPIQVNYITNAPILRISSPSANGVVNQSPILINGSATDAGRGSNGIASVFVNGRRASGDTATAGNQCYWSAMTPLKLGTNQIYVVATDGSTPNLGSTTNILTLTYSPEAITLPDVAVDEQVTLLIDITAKDAELSNQPLAHTLVVGPVGMTISRNGTLFWQPTEAQGPSTNLVEVVVTDGPSSTRKRFSVIVREVNAAPSLTPSPIQVIPEGAALDLLLVADDSDIPAQPLRFSLISGPNGLSISPSGRVSWSPLSGQRPSTNSIQFSVNDGINTVAGQLQVVLVAISHPTEPAQLAIQPTGQTGMFELQIRGSAGVDFVVETSENLIFWVVEKRIIGQGTNTPIRLSEPIDLNTSRRFWRVKTSGR